MQNFHASTTGRSQGADESALNDFLENAKVKRVFASVGSGIEPFWSVLLFYEGEPISGNEKPELQYKPLGLEPVLTPHEQAKYEELRQWRNMRAVQDGIAPYMIAHNQWLKQMVKLPVIMEEYLVKIKGFGEKRTQKYGDEILAILEGIENETK